MKIRCTSKCFTLPFMLIAISLLCISQASASEQDSLNNIFDMSLADLMSVEIRTASKRDEPIDTAPNVMYVITKEEIKLRGYKSLMDVFRYIPGFGVQQRDIQYVSQVRGIAPNDNEKVALMINGHIINQVTEPDLFQSGGFPLHSLERIEVIVGPGSVLYGGETLVAIVNLVTRTADYSEVIATVGNYNSRQVTGSIGNYTDDRHNFFLSASYYSRDGFDAWRKDSSIERNQNLADMEHLTGKVYPSFLLLGTAQHDDWFIQFFSLNAEMPDLHLHGGLFADDGRRTDYINSMLARNKHTWTDRLSTSFEVFGDLKRTSRAVVTVGSGTGNHPSWDLQQTSYGTELATQYKTDKHYFQAGFQYQLKQHRHNYDFQWDPDAPYTYDSNMRAIVKNTDTHSEGVYLSDDYTVTDKIKLVGAVRFDQDNILEADKIYTSPRLAAIYSPTKKWIIKLMYNRASRLAATPQGTSLNKLWGDQQPLAPRWANAQPHIDKPEVLSTIELQNICYVGNTRLSFNVYQQELKDFATWFSPRTNVGDFEGTGCELSTKTQLGNLIIWANAAYSDNDFQVTANTDKENLDGAAGVEKFQLPANLEGDAAAVPAFTANMGTDLKISRNWSFSSTVRYLTRQVMFLDNEWTHADNRFYLDGSVLWENVIGKSWDIRLSANNILDNEEPLGTQWLSDAYTPRGISYELTVFCQF